MFLEDFILFEMATRIQISPRWIVVGFVAYLIYRLLGRIKLK